MSAIAGFNAIAPSDLIINGGPISLITDPLAITDCIVERSIQQASTVSIQFTDPSRSILRSGMFFFGDHLSLDGLEFTLVQFAKASDQLQLEFESAGVAQLRTMDNKTDPTRASVTNTTNITAFAAGLVSAVPGLSFEGSPNLAINSIQCGRGTNTDPNEDSWTCLQRIAATAGWRCFESENVVWFGDDPWLISFPSQGTLQEFTVPVQVMDFSYDIGLPLGNVTVTANTSLWAYPPGSVVTLAGMGIASQHRQPNSPPNGNWLVNDCQRDLFNPQATITLQVATAPYNIINPAPARALI